MMVHVLLPLSLAASLCCSTYASAAAATVEQYIARQGPISLDGVLANIGADGARAAPLGALKGVVIASPSSDPPYAYTWTRDSSLVMKMLIDRFVDGRDKTRLPLIEDWMASQAKYQNLDSPSGEARDTSLGEPKFEVNETAFTGSWGRPQRDGPALRATAFISMANYYIDKRNVSYVQQSLWPAIILDLKYLTRRWNQTTFDLWEETRGSSFFTTATQHRAIQEGIALAEKLHATKDVDLADWKSQASNILCMLQSYWTGGSILANTKSGRSGLDVNTILASVHTYSPNAGCDAKTFQPCSDKALAGHKAVVDSFRGTLYPINANAAANAAVAIGRYKEDVYYGGEPWYLANFAAAEQLYLALNTWTKSLNLQVTKISQPFFAQFVPGIKTGTYTVISPTYWKLLSAIRSYADGFVAINQRYTPTDGSLREQFNRTDGTPLSAEHLTWSYASSLTAFDRRAGRLPPSWPATGLKVPQVCQAGPQPPRAAVTFVVNATTEPGQVIHVTGSVDELQGWSPENGPELNGDAYPIWTVTLDIAVKTNVEYKYVKYLNGSVTWESDPNRSFTTPSNEGETLTLNDTWR
ncbi:glucoamylase [Auriculariales sp. MPI-PUGE-AT-0066]|nr:glucoamylase [Auriculariales sp. MPI-PUGE-AT-0066]